MKISVCIPMYNESSIIADTARTLDSYMRENFEDYEIIFSNDGSTDRSAELVEELGLPNVRVIGYPDNRGKGSAVREAMLAATGDVVMFTDSDLAYGVEVIKRVCDKFVNDVSLDVVIGSRNISADGYEGYTFMRKLASKCYVKVLCIFGGLKLSDSQCGCKAFSGDAAKRIFSLCVVNGFAFDFEAIMLAQRFGMKMAEIPVKIINHRDSKINLASDALKMIKDLVKIRKRISKLPLD